MPSQGVLFIATGEKYIRSAIQSAISIRKYCPDLPIHLFANWKELGFHFEPDPYPFYSVEEVKNPHRRSKVDYMQHTPFDYTLFLDTDTAFNADIRDMFRLLERFDIAATHAHRRKAPVRVQPWRIQIPPAFPQYNAGVLLFRKTEAVMQLMKDWSQAFREAGFPQDQITLRELLWLSDLRIATLPPEYNVRFLKYHYLWDKTEASTQIFHLRKYHDGPLWLYRAFVRFVRKIFSDLGIDIRAWVPKKNE